MWDQHILEHPLPPPPPYRTLSTLVSILLFLFPSRMSAVAGNFDGTWEDICKLYQVAIIICFSSIGNTQVIYLIDEKKTIQIRVSAVTQLTKYERWYLGQTCNRQFRYNDRFNNVFVSIVPKIGQGLKSLNKGHRSSIIFLL